jgi:hypothetical protein
MGNDGISHLLSVDLTEQIRFQNKVFPIKFAKKYFMYKIIYI